MVTDKAFRQTFSLGSVSTQALEDLEHEALQKGWTEHGAGILRQGTLPTAARQTSPCQGLLPPLQ